MQTVKNTKIKLISKVAEYEACDTVDIVYDVLDHVRAESIKNGAQITNNKGKRRIIDNARNKIAHDTVDYSQFKVVKIEQGQTVDPRVIEKKEQQKEQDLESQALALLADLGIDWADDDCDDNEADDSEQESEEVQTVNIEEPQTVENEADDNQQEIQEFTDRMIDELIQQVTNVPQTIKKARTLSDIKSHPYVDGITDERCYGDGIWVHIKEGFINKQLDCREIHEKTVAKCCEILNSMVVPVS